MKGPDSKLQSNNHTLSYYLNRPISLEFLDNYSSKHLTAEPDILFWGICLYVCIFAIFCITLFGGLVKHTENNSKLARSKFSALKNCIMHNVSLAKTEQNTLGSSAICS